MKEQYLDPPWIDYDEDGRTEEEIQRANDLANDRRWEESRERP